MVQIRSLAVFAFAALVLQADTDYRFAFPQSEILLGLDVKWLLKSPLGATMRTEIKSNLGEFKPLESLLDQIETVHLSAVSKNNKQSDVLFLVHGKFETDKLIELGLKNGMRTELWGKTKVLIQPRSKPSPPRKGPVTFQKTQFKMDMPASKPYFALYDNKTILIGEEAPLRVAIERMETGLIPQANPLFERARNLEASNDIWLIGSTAPLNLAPATGKSADPMSQLASQIRNFSVGIAVRRSIAMDLQLQTASPKAATQMLDMAKGVVAMARMAPKDDQPFPIDLDKALELSVAGSILRASLNIEQSEIDKIMTSGLLTTGGGKLTPVPPQQPKVVAEAPKVILAPRPVEPVAPVRKTVMIYGLPGGPKEIPVN